MRTTSSVQAEAPALAVAERLLVNEAMSARAQGETSSWHEADCYRRLAERGWTQQRIADECETEQSRVSRFVACSKLYALGHKRPSFWEAYSEVRPDKGDKQAIHYSSESPEWYTPPQIIEAVLQLFGEIDLDPCSNEAPHNVPARQHFTNADDGLSKAWSGKIYMNPPYGDEIGKWTEKLRAEYEAGRVSEAIALIPGRIDTAWFRALRGDRRCEVAGRLKNDLYEGVLIPVEWLVNPTKGLA